MQEEVKIKSFELDNDLSTKLIEAAKFLFPDHKIEIEEFGLISLIKNNWADPDSFKIGWFEFAMTIALPILLQKYSVKYTYTAISSYINTNSRFAIPGYIVNVIYNEAMRQQKTKKG